MNEKNIDNILRLWKKGEKHFNWNIFTKKNAIVVESDLNNKEYKTEKGG